MEIKLPGLEDFEIEAEEGSILATVKAREKEICLEGMFNVHAACIIDDSLDSEELYAKNADFIHKVGKQALDGYHLIPTNTRNYCHSGEQFTDLISLREAHPDLHNKIIASLNGKRLEECFVFGFISKDQWLIEKLYTQTIPYHKRIMEKKDTISLPLYIIREYKL